MTNSVPVIDPKPNSPLQRLNAFVDKFLLPYPVMFLTNRVIILATLALLVPLLFYTGYQAFVNSLNSYLNVMSVVVSSTVLLYATIADVRDRAAAKQAERIAKAYEQLLEQRINEREEISNAYQQLLEERIAGREAITKAYAEELEKRIAEREEIAKAYEQLLEERIQEREAITRANAVALERRIEGREEVARIYAEELEKRVQIDHDLIEQILHNTIENVLGVELEKIRVEDHKQLENIQVEIEAGHEVLRKELAAKALLDSNEALGKELAELREMIHALYQNQLGNGAAPAS